MVAVLIPLAGAFAMCGRTGTEPTSHAESPGLQEPTASSIAAGPRSAITCPVAAVRIAIGADIQAAVEARPGNTTFCLERGVHKLGGPITPRTGDVFVGEYGAVLDGSGWTSADQNQGAFRAQDQNVDNVTIRNLVIRRMPQKGIHAFPLASGWTIEHNEVAENRTGIAAPDRSMVRHNYIHHNTAGGYSAFRAVGTTFEGNEIAHNGGEQKIVRTRDVVFRNNFVHHNVADGIWYDAENTGSLIEGNRVEDNGREGISYEISGQGVIRTNAVRRNATTGIFISTSKDVEISDNIIEDNLRGIQYFLNCAALSDGFDLANNTAHGNVVVVASRKDAYASGFAHLSSCSPMQVEPYLSGKKNLAFRATRYRVPAAGAKYWFWGYSTLRSVTDTFSWGTGSVKSWTEWQALGHDVDGIVSQ